MLCSVHFSLGILESLSFKAIGNIIKIFTRKSQIVLMSLNYEVEFHLLRSWVAC